MSKNDQALVADVSKVATMQLQRQLEQVQQELERVRSEQEAVRDESQAFGILQKIDYDLAHNKMLKFVVLHRIKQAKDYRQGGMTWAQFCEAIGESQRSVDRVLSEIQPIIEAASAKLADFTGMDFSKIRHLGRTLSANLAEIEDGTLVVDDVKIPLKPENKDDIEALIDNLRESQKKETGELRTKVAKLEKNLEKVVKEETETLRLERDGLIREVKRLKPFDLEEKDRTWSVERMKAVEDACRGFVLACSKFSVDERLGEDMHLQGKIEGMMNEVDKEFADLRRRWNEKFGWDAI